MADEHYARAFWVRQFFGADGCHEYILCPPLHHAPFA